MASNRIKGITIEIDGNTTPLTKSLKDVDKSLKQTQDELKDVNKLLKLDPGNVELLRQKNGLLTEAIGKTKERQEELVKALEQLKKAGDTEENRKQQDALQRELIETSKNLDNLEKEMGEAGDATDKAGKEMDEAKESASKFGEILKAKLAAEAIIAGVKKLAKALEDVTFSAITTSDELATMSQQTGISTDRLQEFQYMAELIDTPLDTITGSLKKLTKKMAEAKSGGKGATEAFKKLGIRVTDINGNLRDSEDVFADAIDALGGINNEAERDAAAMELFGKSASELNPLIEAGSDKIAEYAQEAHDMGYVMDKDVIAKNVEASDAMEKMKNALTGAKNEIGSALAPVIKDIANKLTTFVQKLKDNKEELQKWAGIVSVAAAALIAYKAAASIAAVLTAFKKATEAATIAQAALNAVMNMNPFVLVATAVAAATAAVIVYAKQTKTVSARVAEMQNKIADLHEEVSAQAEAWDDVMKAQEKMLKTGNSELNYYDDLLKELDKLVDENGNVKKGYEDRAKFITDTLGEALGKEIEWTGTQIKGYQNVRAEIEKLIETRKAELILKASEEAYMTAIKNRDQATATLIKTSKALDEAQAQWAAADKRRSDLQIAYNKALAEAEGDYTDQAVVDAAWRLGAAEDEAHALKKIMEGARGEYDTAKETVAEYSYAIAQYEKNLEAAHKEEFGKISSITYEAAKSYTNMSAEEKKAMEAIYGDLAANAGALYQQSKKTAESVLQGATAGLKNKVLRGQAYGEVSTFGTTLIRTLKDVTQVRSPSKATEQIGEYFVQGFGVGLEDQARNLYGEVSAFGQNALAALQGSVSGGISTNIGFNTTGANTLVNASGSAAAPAGVNVSVTINGNVDNYDELAETIGQKLQQQMARQARAWA